ncbi:MAG: UDP-glucose 4-epimerase GalE [Planctomycetes bacterium]|nr:UDP-glucose 4-epimerase GalE [Planctomycetota bacterium]
MNVLVTGGAGYIGSHAVQRLLRDGHTVFVLDNLVRGHRKALRAIGLGTNDRLRFIEGEVTKPTAITRAFRQLPFDCVMHFAALAYVGESVDQPLRYYDANTTGLLRILQACEKFNVRRLVFSSSCSTYGDPPEGRIPVDEDCPQHPVSPYGRTKLAGEWLIRDFAESRRRAGKPFAYAFLRYFNVCGCDTTGLLGEDHEPETHLVPILLEVALGKRERVDIHGTDYPTPDGTCVRDYVHVEDLIDAHVLAMEKMRDGEGGAYNVGIGKGYSVRQIIESARRVTKHAIPSHEGPRRAGDAAMLYNNPEKIRRELGWSPKHTDLDEIIATAWRWFSANPNGYES